MKIMNRIFILTIILSMISLPSIMAYNENLDFDGNLPDGLWGSLFAEEDTKSSQSVNTPLDMPLTADLDDDGDIEIVVARDNGFSVFRNYDGNLFIEASYLEIGGWSSAFQNFMLYDIDNDGLIEIVAMTATHIYIIEYDGDTISEQTSFTHGLTVGAGMIQCKQSNSCIAVATSSNGMSAGNTYIYARTFSSSGVSGQGIYTVMTQTGSVALPAYRGICLSTIRHIEVENLDMIDSEDEYIFNSVRIGIGSSGYADESMYVHALRTNASNYIVDNTVTTIDIPDIWSLPVGNGCTSNPSIESRFSPVLIHEASGTDSDGREIIVSYMTDGNAYKLFVYDRGGSLLDDFPDIQTQDGRIISNVFLADIFPDTGEECEIGEDLPELEDYCVMGYNEPDEIIKILCGSTQTNEDHSFFTKTREFYFDTTAYTGYNFSISSGRNEYYRVTHATQQAYDKVEDDDSCDPNGFNPSEFYTPYGILQIVTSTWDDNPTFTPKDADLSVMYSVEGQEGVMIGVPTKAYISTPDILHLTYNQLFLVDNGDYNRRAYISTRSIDPCIEQNGSIVSWMSGTDATIQVIGNDNENDLVSSRVTLYYGLSGITPLEPIIEYQWGYDTESDDSIDGVESSFGGKDVNEVYHVAFLARDVSTINGYVDAFNMTLTGLTGNPEANSYIYDVYLCPTDIDSLNAQNNPFFYCNVTESLVLDNLQLSSLATSAGTYNFEFDNEYVLNSSYDNYLLVMMYVSGTETTSYWDITTDSAPTSNLMEVFTINPPVLTIVSDTVVAEIAEITLFNGEEVSYERTNGWTSYVPTGIPMTHIFSDVDYNIPIADIKIEIRDEANENNPRFLLDSFSVQSTGVTKGECITIGNFDDPDIPTEEEEEETDPTGSPLDVDDNAITNGLNTMDELGFRGLGGTIKWLFIMGIVAIAMFFVGAGRGYTGFQTTSMVVISMIIMVTIGVYLKVIPVSLVIISAIVAFGLTVGMFKIFFGGTRD